jgi:ribosomal protein S18 acetylase RimI-like enzyme
MEIRRLNSADAAAYREMRLAALREHPLAFVSDYSEEAGLPMAVIEQRLASDLSDTFGVFEGSRLVAIGTLLRTARLKQRFRATIVGMYVAPDYRHRGLATRLLTACASRAREFLELEELALCITIGNDAAREAYIKFGFQPEFIAPRDFKHAGCYYDLEWLRLPLK